MRRTLLLTASIALVALLGLTASAQAVVPTGDCSDLSSALAGAGVNKLGAQVYVTTSGDCVNVPGLVYCRSDQLGTCQQSASSAVDTVSNAAGAVVKPSPAVPSDDCVTPSATLIDGYFGSLYARLRTQGTGSDTWVCARLQPEGATEYAGGKFLISDAASAISTDANSGACSSQADNVLPPPHPIRDGHVGDPSSPPYVPYLLDAYANGGGAAWVCLQASLGARVMVNGAASVFKQDNPAPAVSPLRTAWTTGKASADCEGQSGGTRTRLVNAVISGTQVWLDAWQSGSKSELCVRVQGSTTAGGVLTVDPAGAPGVTPVLSQGTDTTACNTDVFVDNQDQLYVRRSPTTANPASVCITKGTTSQRFTLGYAGSVQQPNVSWTADS
jgi:hypothetical protein